MYYMIRTLKFKSFSSYKTVIIISPRIRKKLPNYVSTKQRKQYRIVPIADIFAKTPRAVVYDKWMSEEEFIEMMRNAIEKTYKCEETRQKYISKLEELIKIARTPHMPVQQVTCVELMSDVPPNYILEKALNHCEINSDYAFYVYKNSYHVVDYYRFKTIVIRRCDMFSYNDPARIKNILRAALNALLEAERNNSKVAEFLRKHSDFVETIKIIIADISIRYSIDSESTKTQNLFFM